MQKELRMTLKQILDRASTALPSLAGYYNDAGQYVDGAGDTLAAYIAKVLIENFDPDPDLTEEGQRILLVSFLDQAIADLTRVSEALEDAQ
jgi:hypothetical protein